jgi:hypothetical protein
MLEFISMNNPLFPKYRIIIWIVATLTCFALGWYVEVSGKYEFGPIASGFAATRYGIIFYAIDLIITFFKKPIVDFNKFQIALMGIIVIFICPAASMLGFGLANFIVK